MKCYLCNLEKREDDFIVRKDGIRYKLCKICNRDVQRKIANGKKLHHTLENRTCYKCMLDFCQNKFY